MGWSVSKSQPWRIPTEAQILLRERDDEYPRHISPTSTSDRTADPKGGNMHATKTIENLSNRHLFTVTSHLVARSCVDHWKHPTNGSRERAFSFKYILIYLKHLSLLLFLLLLLGRQIRVWACTSDDCGLLRLVLRSSLVLELFLLRFHIRYQLSTNS